jgi:phosphoglycerate dehydrogenase-like enzyme
MNETNRHLRVAITSRAFSQNQELRDEVQLAYEHVRFNETGRQLSPQETIDFVKGADAAIVSLEKIDEIVLSSLPELQLISKYGVGLDNVDFGALLKSKLKFAWAGGVNRRSVAELALSFMLISLRKSAVAHKTLVSGVWKPLVGGQLTGKTVGIVGCGFIGKDLVRLLKPFGCKILVNDIIENKEFYLENEMEACGLDDLIMRSHIVSLHVPLNRTTRNIMNRERLRKMQAGALLINTARGGLVDEEALKMELMAGRILAAFDVFSEEPARDQELITHPSFFCTPHMGGSSEEAVLAMGRAAIAGLKEAIPVDEWLKLHPENHPQGSL